MAIRKYTTGIVTMTGATDTSILREVRGRIKSIAIKPSGSSTDFKVTCEKAGITEYILGGSSATITVTDDGTILYPKTRAQDILGVDLDETEAGDIWQEIAVVSQDVTISVTNGANDETYVVEIIAEE
jgi:hypothetical protein